MSAPRVSSTRPVPRYATIAYVMKMVIVPRWWNVNVTPVGTTRSMVNVLHPVRFPGTTDVIMEHVPGMVVSP